MDSERLSARLWKGLFNVCFLVLFFQALALAEWIVVSTLRWRSPTARLAPAFGFLLALEVVSLIFYFRRPWIAALVSWVGVALVAARAIPWGKPGWGAAVHQFDFQIFTLITAHAGVASFIMMNRADAEPADSAVGIECPQPQAAAPLLNAEPDAKSGADGTAEAG